MTERHLCGHFLPPYLTTTAVYAGSSLGVVASLRHLNLLILFIKASLAYQLPSLRSMPPAYW